MENDEFVLTTKSGNYSAKSTKGDKPESDPFSTYWEVIFRKDDSSLIKGVFQLPGNWARSRVFQFIDEFDQKRW